MQDLSCKILKVLSSFWHKTFFKWGNLWITFAQCTAEPIYFRLFRA